MIETDSQVSNPNGASIKTDSEVQSTLENYATTYSEFKGSYGILVETDDACVGLQFDGQGNLFPHLIEAYGEDFGSDYIPNAPDIFEYKESPHRDLMKILENPAVSESMAYRFIYREPEGSEEDREYAEYRDVFGPMRLSRLKLKLGIDTFIRAERSDWDSNTIEISISRAGEVVEKTDQLDELATKYTKGLVDASLVEWIDFF